jgi:hypothetical protein
MRQQSREVIALSATRQLGMAAPEQIQIQLTVVIAQRARAAGPERGAAYPDTVGRRSKQERPKVAHGPAVLAERGATRRSRCDPHALLHEMLAERG